MHGPHGAGAALLRGGVGGRWSCAPAAGGRHVSKIGRRQSRGAPLSTLPAPPSSPASAPSVGVSRLALPVSAPAVSRCPGRAKGLWPTRPSSRRSQRLTEKRSPPRPCVSRADRDDVRAVDPQRHGAVVAPTPERQRRAVRRSRNAAGIGKRRCRRRLESIDPRVFASQKGRTNQWGGLSGRCPSYVAGRPWEQPDCPRSSPKLVQLVASHAHEQ